MQPSSLIYRRTCNVWELTDLVINVFFGLLRTAWTFRCVITYQLHNHRNYHHIFLSSAVLEYITLFLSIGFLDELNWEDLAINHFTYAFFWPKRFLLSSRLWRTQICLSPLVTDLSLLGYSPTYVHLLLHLMLYNKMKCLNITFWLYVLLFLDAYVCYSQHLLNIFSAH